MELLPHLFANRGDDDVLKWIETIDQVEEERRIEEERLRETPGFERNGNTTPYKVKEKERRRIKTLTAFYFYIFFQKNNF